MRLRNVYRFLLESGLGEKKNHLCEKGKKKGY